MTYKLAVILIAFLGAACVLYGVVKELPVFTWGGAGALSAVLFSVIERWRKEWGY